MPLFSKASFGAVLIAYVLYNIRWTFVFSHLNNVLTPERYHGKYVTDNYFEGWYIKMVTIHPDGSLETVSIIPGIYRPPIEEESTEKVTGAHAFIMLIRSSYEEALYYRYRVEEFGADKKPLDPTHGYEISIGNSTFWNDGMSLDLDPKNLMWISDDELKEYTRRRADEWIEFGNKYSTSNNLTNNDILMFMSKLQRGTDTFKRRIGSTVIKATLKFTKMRTLSKTFMDLSAMGVVYYFPFFECYHNIPAMYMKVHGTINSGVNDLLQFHSDTASGYVEKDHGYNFPTKYTWLQSNNFEVRGTTLSISVAEIPILSRSSRLYKVISVIPYIGPYFQWIANPTGFIIKFLHPEIGLIGFDVFSSKITSLRISHEDGKFQVLNLTVTNSYFELRVSGKRHVGSGLILRAPRKEARDMTLMLEETMDASLSVLLVQKQTNEYDVDKIIFEGTGRAAGMEIVGDMENIIEKGYFIFDIMSFTFLQ